MKSGAVLVILDGFGIGHEGPYNAINNAEMPFYRSLIKKYPQSELLTHGQAVGLPAGVMGNSEVGHMAMGAGRVIYQDLTRIHQQIKDREFFSNPVLIKTLEAAAESNGRVHLMGLLSDGGVHSHIEHLLALLDLCMELKIPRVSVHAFMDGRDTPPQSGIGFMRDLLRHPSFLGQSPTQAKIATVSGRYWAMDRDQRWERVEKAYRAMTGQIEVLSCSPIDAIQKSYDDGKTDEFIEPLCFDSDASVRDGDSLVFFNYRSDRAREISLAFNSPELSQFNRGKPPELSAFCGMTCYDKSLDLAYAYGPQNLNNIFGEWLEKRELSQFRIAETEKYAHVTFFFNGGREAAFKKEDRILIPSPREIATYDLKPEMSAHKIAEEAAARLRLGSYDFVLMNFANADMVGHTGNYLAAIQAMETLDQCLSQVVGAAEKNGYHVLITADHGNAEEMCDAHGAIHTQHTLNPVPAIWVAPDSAVAPKSVRKALKDGSLQDIMPTLCELMNLPVPSEVTGQSLIPKS